MLETVPAAPLGAVGAFTFVNTRELVRDLVAYEGAALTVRLHERSNLTTIKVPG